MNIETTVKLIDVQNYHVITKFDASNLFLNVNLFNDIKKEHKLNNNNNVSNTDLDNLNDKKIKILSLSGKYIYAELL